MCAVDVENNNERILIGPLTYILVPQETVKVSICHSKNSLVTLSSIHLSVTKIVYLSSGKPKRPNMIKAAKIKLGPSFMSAIFTVRTKDKADQQSAHKVFALIRYSCPSLCSGISEEAARHNFEGN